MVHSSGVLACFSQLEQLREFKFTTRKGRGHFKGVFCIFAGSSLGHGLAQNQEVRSKHLDSFEIIIDLTASVFILSIYRSSSLILFESLQHLQFYLFSIFCLLRQRKNQTLARLNLKYCPIVLTFSNTLYHPNNTLRNLLNCHSNSTIIGFHFPH